MEAYMSTSANTAVQEVTSKTPRPRVLWTDRRAARPKRSTAGSMDRFMSVLDGPADVEAARLLAWPGIRGEAVNVDESPLQEGVAIVLEQLFDKRLDPRYPFKDLLSADFGGEAIDEAELHQVIEAAYALGIAMGRRLNGARLSVAAILSKAGVPIPHDDEH
jgi:hypothetical protein